MSRPLKTQKHTLRQEREQRGWSQAKVAEAVGTTTHTVGRWERGLSLPYPYFREKLCALFEKDAVALGFVLEIPTQPVPISPVSASAFPQITRIADPLLPTLPYEVIGRSDLLNTLKQQVCKEGKNRLVALNGLPGVGKTTLAVALARNPEVQQHFPDGVLWAGLGMSPNHAGLFARWATLLGVSFSLAKERTIQEWMTALHIAIGSRRLLLVLDDVWDEEVARAFQVGGSGCAYLLTTRMPQIAYAWAGNEAILVAELEEANGIALLAHFVPALVRHNQQTAAELVHLVGGLPLALRLIGKYLGAQEHTKQPRRLRSALQRLQIAEHRLHLTAFGIALGTCSDPSVCTSPVSLQSVIAVSEARLTERERTAFSALSVFPVKPNSFSEAAALAVIEDTSEVLDALYDAGLIEGEQPERYTIHQTIADYARSLCRSEQASACLASYYLRYVKEHANDFPLLEQESTNIFIALQHASQLSHSTLFVQGVLAFFPFLNARGFYTLAEQYLTQAYHSAKKGPDTLILATLCHQLGLIALSLGKSVCVDTYAQEGLRLITRSEHPELACDLLTLLGSTAFKRGNLVQADTYYQEERVLAQRHQVQHSSARCLANLEVIARHRAEYTQAEAYSQELLAQAQHTQDHQSLIMAYTSLGVLAAHRGDQTQATIHFQNALTFARQYGKRDHVIRLLLNTGDARRKQENYAGAESYFMEALHLAQQSGHQEFLGYVLENLGELARERGQYALADTYLQEGLTLARQLAHHQLLPLFLKEVGELLLCRQHFIEAEEVFQELVVVSNSSERNHSMLAFAQYGLARLAEQRGAFVQAYHLGKAGLLLFTAVNHEHAQVVKKWLATLPPESGDEDESRANDGEHPCI